MLEGLKALIPDDTEVSPLGTAYDEYTTTRLRVRRRMASVAFGLAIALGTTTVLSGLFLDGVDGRIDRMGTFLSFFFTALFGIVSWYWGLGTYEHGAMVKAAVDGDSDNGGVRDGDGGREREDGKQDHPRSPDKG